MRTLRPDTCECYLELTIVDGEMTDGSPISKCSVHGGVSDGDIYEVILGETSGENRRKNFIFGQITGSMGVELEYENYLWSFSGEGADRVLEVDGTGMGLTSDQKAELQDYADTAFGSGKVAVN